MAKLRSNHTKGKQAKGSSGMIAKVGIFSLILGVLYFAFDKIGINLGGNEASTETEESYEDVSNLEETEIADISYLPTSTTGDIILHEHYALSYSEKHEQAEWVAYELSKNRLNQPWVDRTNDFREDRKVESGSASTADYRRTGYDRGHLVPAADMAFSREAMSETFFMSNMSPQARKFNQGVWRELEELTRDWAKKMEHLYVVSGPVLTEKIKYWVGDNQVAVPSAYFKVLLDLTEPDMKGIGFIMPNEKTEEPVQAFATTIDEVESITGLNFFPNLLGEELESKLESHFDSNEWPTNNRKYKLRVEQWNVK